MLHRRLSALVFLLAVVAAVDRRADADDAVPAAPPAAAIPPAAPTESAVDRKPKRPKPACVDVPVDLALWSSVSINALYPPCARNLFGLALAMGRAGELHGLQLGVLGQSAEYGVRGVQIAGLLVASGEDTVGVQIAGLIAAAGDSFTGLQLSGLAAAGNRARGGQLGVLGVASGNAMAGLQAGGLFAASGNAMTGLQAGGLFAASGNAMTGLQAGGLFAASGNAMTGLQIGGLFAASGELAGLQVGVGGSLTGGGRGVQLAGGMTRAQGELTGAQIAIVNIGRTVNGAQIGLVNIAREVHGLQLGLVNVADRADAPVGLVSWMRDGDRGIEVWGGEAVPVAAAARFGTTRVYSLVGLGADPLRAHRTWGPLGGAGVRVPVGPVAIHADALGHAVVLGGFDRAALLAQARLRLVVPVGAGLAVFAGPTWNVFVSGDDAAADLPLGLDQVGHHGGTVIRQWPGLTAGAALSY